MALYSAGDAALRCLPDALMRRAAAAGARLAFDAQTKNARVALVNLQIAYPKLSEDERFALGRQSYVNLAVNALEYLRSNHWSDTEVLERCPLEGLEHVEQALSKGKGAFLLTLHIGNFELGVQAIAIGLSRYRPAVLGRPMRNQRLYERIARTRTRAGAELINKRQAAARILRALRQNRPVGVLLDQYSPRSRGVFVPLFGKRCSTSAGIATLALRTGAAVLPCYVLRAGPDRHRAIFEAELEIPLTGERKRDIEIATAHYNQALERIIRANPEQWMWGHRRFRHSPDLDGNPYTPTASP